MQVHVTCLLSRPCYQEPGSQGAEMSFGLSTEPASLASAAENGTGAVWYQAGNLGRPFTTAGTRS
eukprot:1130504-Rhodomonas_salina.1